MGLIAKQAYSNTLNIAIGIVAGAINTIIVLPHAFESTPQDWGLVRTLLAYGLIIAQVFGFGTYNIIVREYVNHNNPIFKKAILGFSLLQGLIGLILFLGFLVFFKDGIDLLIDEQDLNFLYENQMALLILAGIFIFTQTFTGFIVANHKTPVVQFVNDVFLKITYLFLALAYWLNPFPFDLYLQLFIGTYILSLIIYISYSISIGFRFNFKLKLLKIKSLLIYGGFTVLDRGAGILVNNLDLIMIGLILDLENVAYYILAFYIGAVIIIPQRAILGPSYPLVSNYVREGNLTDTKKLYIQTSINQLIVGGVLFVFIWINIDAIYQLIPTKCSGGIWVVFYIGLSKLFILVTGISGAIIIFSKYYRMNLLFNILLIFSTILTNYFLIIKFGINGAAIATAITFLTYNVLKVVYIQYRFKMQPFTFETIKSVIILLIVGVIGTYIEIFAQLPLISIVIKSLIISILLAIGFYGLKVKAEILELPIKLFKKDWR